MFGCGVRGKLWNVTSCGRGGIGSNGCLCWVLLVFV